MAVLHAFSSHLNLASFGVASYPTGVRSTDGEKTYLPGNMALGTISQTQLDPYGKLGQRADDFTGC